MFFSFTKSKLRLDLGLDMISELPLRPCLLSHIVIHLPVQQMSEEQSYCKSVAKKQQQQAQLSKLPRHHPLLREPHSDEGCFFFKSISNSYSTRLQSHYYYDDDH